MIALLVLPVALLAVLPVGSAFSPVICPRGPGGVVGGGLRQSATAHQPGICAVPWACTTSKYLVVAPVHIRVRISPVRAVARTALRAQRDEAEGAESFSDALVDFKGAPCLVTNVSEAEKAEILQLNRKTRKAKLKDLQIVFLAHILKSQQHRASVEARYIYIGARYIYNIVPLYSTDIRR